MNRRFPTEGGDFFHFFLDFLYFWNYNKVKFFNKEKLKSNNKTKGRF